MASAAMTDRRPPDARDDVDWGDLIGRMARADETALTRFYDGTSRLVYGLAVRITRDPAAAEELTLAVYCQAWRQAKAYSPARRSPTSWLFTLARSRALDQLRSRIRRDQGREEALEAAGGLADARPRSTRNTCARVVMLASPMCGPSRR
ncbi:MAG: hypothetical protein DMF82_18545 [Acidobacteria bacterium]|nr:MAG: hypothetical protein DMF82_18545 [Acidobacteriota bacterium]